ncbi:unnamed protein product, partial [Discosporangium mesarthrocarpum]
MRMYEMVHCPLCSRAKVPCLEQCCDFFVNAQCKVQETNHPPEVAVGWGFGATLPSHGHLAPRMCSVCCVTLVDVFGRLTRRVGGRAGCSRWLGFMDREDKLPFPCVGGMHVG